MSPDDVGIEGEPDETGATFETNARIKARYYAARSGLPTLADDSGLEVDALDGAPGRLHAPLRGPGRDRRRTTTRSCCASSPALTADRRGARYVCVLALALPGEAGPRGGLRILTRRGTCRGRIAPAPRGTAASATTRSSSRRQEPPGGQTLGEWSAEAKNAISHRSRAAARMSPVLRSLGVLASRSGQADAGRTRRACERSV